MKSAVLLFSGVMFLSAGCSNVKNVELDQRDQWIATASRQLVRREATVQTRDGNYYEGTIISMTSNSLSLKDQSNGPLLIFPLDSLASVRPQKKAGPPFNGIVGGAIVGALIGGFIGAPNSTVEGSAAGAAVGALTVGIVIGSATEVTEYKITSHPTPEVHLQAVPVVADTAQTKE